MKYALVIALLAGCASVPKSAEDTIREVKATADKLEKALDVAQEKTAPVIAGIDTACAVAAPDSEGCKTANEVIERFELALDKAQLAVDAYRDFTGDFGAASRALAEVMAAAAEVVKAALDK